MAAAFEEEEEEAQVVVVVIVIVLVIAMSGNKEAAASGVITTAAIELPCIIALDATGVVGFSIAALFVVFVLFSSLSLSFTRRMLLELSPLLLTLSSD